MILAAIEGNLIALIVFAAIGVINWLLQKKEEKANQSPPPGTRPRPSRPESEAGAPSRPAPDDERLRRFMEALGLPADQAPPPAPRPPPLPHPIREMPPVPRASGQTIPRRPRRVPPEPPPLPRRGRSLDDEPEPSLPVQQISLPVLETTPLSEFVTVSSRIAAIPDFAGSGEAEPDAYREHVMLPPAGQGGLTELLRSPDDLRRAVLLREILGPPRGIEQFGHRI